MKAPNDCINNQYLTSIQAHVTTDIYRILNLRTSRTGQAHLAVGDLVLAKQSAGLGISQSKAAYLGAALGSQNLAYVAGRVDQIGLGQFPSLNIQFHAGVAVFPVVWAAMPIAAAAFSYQITPAVVFGRHAQHSPSTFAIVDWFEVVVNLSILQIYFASSNWLLFFELEHHSRQVLLGLYLMHSGCMLGGVGLHQTRPAKSTCYLHFGTFGHMAFHIT